MTCNVAAVSRCGCLSFCMVGSLSTQSTWLGASNRGLCLCICVSVCVCGAFSTPVWHITIDLHWISITASCRFAVCFCPRWRWNAGIKLISNDFVPKLSLLPRRFFLISLSDFSVCCGKKNWNACRPGRMLRAGSCAGFKINAVDTAFGENAFWVHTPSMDRAKSEGLKCRNWLIC